MKKRLTQEEIMRIEDEMIQDFGEVLIDYIEENDIPIYVQMATMVYLLHSHALIANWNKRELMKFISDHIDFAGERGTS